ncbi:MAG: hypothetical protein ABIF19_09325 [Planctomycetota bacterium]
MKLNTSMTTTAVLFCILTIGCEENVEQGPDKPLINSWLINSYSDTAIENAIISQHTVFPYHFVKNASQLNELGKRDLAVLAGHFMKYAGDLNIRRHNTPADLYEARVNAVVERLQEAGVNIERMNIADGMPGGEGMASEKVLIILEEASETTSAASSTTNQSGTRK